MSFRDRCSESTPSALAAVAYIFVREHQKIRSKPDFQQSLIVLAALAFYEGFLFFMDAYSGHPLTSPLSLDSHPDWRGHLGSHRHHSRLSRAALVSRSRSRVGHASRAHQGPLDRTATVRTALAHRGRADCPVDR